MKNDERKLLTIAIVLAVTDLFLAGALVAAILVREPARGRSPKPGLSLAAQVKDALRVFAIRADATLIVRFDGDLKQYSEREITNSLLVATHLPRVEAELGSFTGKYPSKYNQMSEPDAMSKKLFSSLADRLVLVHRELGDHEGAKVWQEKSEAR